ncbi:MAG: FAD-binding protein [Desulfarculaceae bacterium]|nr:FAD-binding protein [Desulfarculaceae bacterium]MCF8048169.1 FAD-binding protein [Desulfarculaceae bacterium]MCF8121921.1 FAD-binding protein [Desulfarculaceae bacterium]
MDINQRLAEIVGQENLITNQADCQAYSRDMSVHMAPPQVMVFAETTEQVSEILAACHQAEVPVIARGGGTSVTGAALAPKGGVLLNLIRMNKILEINLPDHYARVQCGVVCGALNAAVAEKGFFFPPDPGSAGIATIGGMISTNASGIRAVKYGTTKDYVMALKVVLADGRILDTGSKAPKTSSGYNLSQLFCASEGTLGVVTEATMKILPAPAYAISARLEFPDIQSAGDAVTEMLTTGVPIATCEILDNISIAVLAKAIDLKVDEGVGCMIMLELDGHKTAVQDYVKQVDAIAAKHGILNAKWTDDPVEKAPLWEARHRLVPAMSRLKPGYRLVPLMEDFGVPMTKIPETIRQIQAIGEKHGFPIATFGHIGDGNLHATFIMDVKKADEWDAVKKIVLEFVELTASMEGTMSAEHGLGMAKSPVIMAELGATGMEVMQTIKDALDPKDILNPGKMGLRDSIDDVYDTSGFEPLRTGSLDVASFGEVDNEIVACIQCGFCRLGCPTYAQTDLESMNAKGRITLAFSLLSGQMEPSADMAERLYKCMLCLNCKYTCPAQINVASVVQAARQRLVEKGFLPEIFVKLMSDMVEAGNPFSMPRDTRTDSYPVGYEAKPGADTMLHLGCVASYQDVKIIPAVMKILDAAGIDFTTLGKDENCCGYLAYLVGDMDTFHTVAAANDKIFKEQGVGTLLTTCAGCYKTFEDVYPHQGHGDGYKPEHVVFLLERLINEGKLNFKDDGKPMKAIYHDPCDLGRHLGVYEPPREVIKALPGVDLLEFPQNRTLAKCCGGGGGVKAFANELGGDIAFERIKAAIAQGADTVVSACPSCKNSLNQAAARARKEKLGKVKVLDITELVASRLAK